jgi:hypothetical protein
VAEAIRGTIRCQFRAVIFENAVPAWVGSRVGSLGFVPSEGAYIRGVSRENESGERVGRVTLDLDDSEYVEVTFYAGVEPGSDIESLREHFGTGWDWEAKDV